MYAPVSVGPVAHHHRTHHRSVPARPTQHLGPEPGTEGGGLPAGRLVCRGDLDLSSVGSLALDVEKLIALGYRDVHVEIDSLRFCDVVGLRALLAARDRLNDHGGTLSLTEHTCRSLSLLLTECRLSAQLRPIPA